mmetsp:Transcript_17216/g.56357  ORF Transcript_17216/g.56357 Transcript_17216/m.56357 type:complete len:205 (-) Transcript_17216:387-1001(-)
MSSAEMRLGICVVSTSSKPGTAFEARRYSSESRIEPIVPASTKRVARPAKMASSRVDRASRNPAPRSAESCRMKSTGHRAQSADVPKITRSSAPAAGSVSPTKMAGIARGEYGLKAKDPPTTSEMMRLPLKKRPAAVDFARTSHPSCTSTETERSSSMKFEPLLLKKLALAHIVGMPTAAWRASNSGLAARSITATPHAATAAS